MSIGKEAKIGLGVIVLLLIVFGVVLARRLTTDRPNEQPIADVPEKKEPPKTDEKDAKKAPADKPTALGGKQGRTPSGRGSEPLDMGRWSPPERSHGNTPPAPKPAGRTGEATAGGADAYDPFHGRAPLGSAEATSRGSEATLRMPNPPQPTRETANYGATGAAAKTPTPAAGARAGQASTGGEPQRLTMASDGRYAASPDRYAATPERYSPGGHGGVGPAPAPAPSYPAYGDRYEASPRHGGASGGYGATADRYDRYATTPARPTSVRNGRREDGKYEIQPNDSYWTISEKCYGNGGYFKALAKHNQKRVPQQDDLKVGDVIEAPEVTQLEKMYPELCPKRREAAPPSSRMVSTPRHHSGKTYTTQEGDTLYDIARRELGRASRWIEVYDLNREQIGSDYNYVPPGLQLALPGDEPARPDSMTRRLGPPVLPPGYQR